MCLRRLLRPALFALVLLAGCTGGRHERPVAQYTSEPWKFARRSGWKLATEHYEIYTTLRDPVLREALPDFVEAAYAQYTTLVPPARPPAEPLRVYLFESRQELEAYTRKTLPSRADMFLKIHRGGYSEQGVSVIEYVTHEVTFPLFGHEGFHQYMHHCVSTNMPAWLNEGFATLCEGQRWGDLRLKSFDPWYNPRRTNDLADALAREKLHPLRKLLRTHAGEIIEGTTRSVSAYYAQVWALVLFLREGADGRYAPRLDRLLTALRENRLEQFARAAQLDAAAQEYSFGEAVFRAFISDDLETVETEYLAFMRDRFLLGKKK